VVTPRRSLDTGFASYLLKFPPLVRKFRGDSQGLVSDTWSLKFTAFSRVAVPLPPLPEQKKIAAILSSVDEAIQAKRTVIEQTRRVKEGLLQDLLTRGIGHTRFKQTEIGEIPEGWEVRRIADLASVVRGGSPRPAGDSRFFNGDFIPWITVREVTKDDEIYLNETATMLTESGSERSRILEAGTLVLTNSGATLGLPKILRITGCANDGIAAFLRLKPVVDKLFLYYCLSRLTGYLRNVVAPGLGQPNLNTSLIGDQLVPVPPLEEEGRIVAALQSADSAIGQASQSLGGYESVKAGLLQDLLTGRVRVSV
jgi:type I restriction enzyme S subunit